MIYLKFKAHSVTIITIQFMLITEQSVALHETLQQTGYGSFKDFALVKAKEKLLEKIKMCPQHIKKFEGKQGVDYTGFFKTLHQLNYPLLEKERIVQNGMQN